MLAPRSRHKKGLIGVENEQNNVPRSTFNAVIIAITFLVVGVVVGIIASNNLLTREDVRQTVKEVLAEQSISVDTATIEQAVANALAKTPITVTGGNTTDGTTASIDQEALERIVADAIAKANTGNPNRFELVDNDPYLGEEDAPIVIVEFSAYACPYCGRHFTQTLQPLLENYGQHVRYVYRDFPTINPDVSFPASMAAECANEQGKFWEFHDVLFSNQSSLGRDLYLSTAETLGLDVPSFTACIDEQRYLDEVNADYFDGSLQDITGTPTFIINGQTISGAQPYAIFERIVLRELEKAGIDPNS